MKGFTLRLATLDRHVPDWCATHFSYSLEKMRERANVDLRVPGRVFWKPHTMTNLKEVKQTILTKAALLFLKEPGLHYFKPKFL